MAKYYHWPSLKTAKLQTSDVAVIKRLLLNGATDSELAARYGVSKDTIRKIRTGISWRRVAPAKEDVA
jgi:transposase